MAALHRQIEAHLAKSLRPRSLFVRLRRCRGRSHRVLAPVHGEEAGIRPRIQRRLSRRADGRRDFEGLPKTRSATADG
jgi:hypothetical protein